MAERADLEFTYSLIDRIFRLSLGELADFSGAKYDGDFSLTLEEAQRRKHDYVAEQIGIGPGRRVLDLGCGWGPLLDFIRSAGRSGVGVTLSSAQAAACRRHGLDVHLDDARELDRETLRPVRRRGEPRRLRALLLAGGVPSRAPGGDLPRPLRADRERAARRRALYLQTMVFGRNMIPDRRRSTSTPRATPTPGTSRCMGRQFPGSWLPFGQEQIVRTRRAALPPRLERERPARLHRDDPAVAAALRGAEPPEDAAQAAARARAGSPAPTSGSPSPPGVSANSVCFERELLDHYRLVFERA